jgi:ABC-2 type transport system permease protein
MSAIFKRELRAYFSSPLAYIVLFIYMMLSGVVFGYFYQSGEPSINTIFNVMYTVAMFIIPILTMRSFSEERRQKTDQALFTAPVKLSSVVMGKFFAALAVFGIANAMTVIYQLVFAAESEADWVIYFCSLLGTALFASALISIGIFISSLTESQMTAAIGSIGVSILLSMLDLIANLVDVGFVTTVTSWIAFQDRFITFTEGIIDYANIAFFLSVTAVFLFLTVRVQEKKRWS